MCKSIFFFTASYILMHSTVSAISQCEQVDKMSSNIWRMGDPTRPLPTTEQGLEREYCSLLNDKKSKTIHHFDTYFPNNKDLRIAIRLVDIERRIIISQFCQNSNTKADTVRHLTVINSKVDQLKPIRDKFVDWLHTVAEPNSTVNLKTLINRGKEYLSGSEAVLPAPTGKWLKDVLDRHFDLAFHLLEVLSPKPVGRGASLCPTLWKPRSVLYSAYMAVNRILSHT